MTRLSAIVFACVAGLSLFAYPASAQDAPSPVAKPKFVTTDGYPLDTCVETGKELGKKPKTFQVEGRTFKTCCSKCEAKLTKTPEKAVTDKAAAVKAAQLATYPLTTCPVSGKALDSMGGPHDIVVDNYLVRLCCEKCSTKAEAKKEEIVAKLQTSAFEQQSKSYAAKTCPVSGHDLDADAVAVMHGTRLVKLCCTDCMDKFTQTPNGFTASVTSPATPRAETKPEGKGADKDKQQEGAGGKRGQGGTAAADDKGEGCCEGEAKGCCENGEAKPGCCSAGAKAPGKKVD
jgi:hypothetical protein